MEGVLSSRESKRSRWSEGHSVGRPTTREGATDARKVRERGREGSGSVHEK